MKIRTSDWYGQHQNCEAGDSCERLYCGGKTHRLLYRLCESVKDRGDDGEWFSGDCPECHDEYETQKYVEERALQDTRRIEELAIDRAIDADREHQVHGV